MPKGPQGQKRPADVIGAAVMVARLATEENSEPTKEKSGRTRSGKAGAKARANKGGTPRDRKKGGRGEMEMKKPDIQREVDDNYEEFKKLLPTIIGQHRDKFALMKEKKVLGYFSTAQDAREAADSFGHLEK